MPPVTTRGNGGTDGSEPNGRYERILVPTDGSELSTVAARHALGLARQYDATVHVLYVIDTETSRLAVSKSELREALEDLGRDASERAFRAITNLPAYASVDATTNTLEGVPSEQILAYIDENDIDLVVMGTHGRSGLEHRLVGSVTDRIVRGSPVPVMTVGRPLADGSER